MKTSKIYISILLTALLFYAFHYEANYSSNSASLQNINITKHDFWIPPSERRINYFKQEKTTPSINNVESNKTIFSSEKLLEQIEKNTFDENTLSQCEECLISLRNILLSDDLSRDQIINIATALTIKNRPELSRLLASVAQEIMQREGSSERIDVMLSALSSFDSPEIAALFSQSILDATVSGIALPEELAAVLRNNINQVSDRNQVALNIAQQFEDSYNQQAQEQLLALNHPETLEKISFDTLENGDYETFKSVLSRLKTIDDKHVFNVFLNLHSQQDNYSEQTLQITEAAKEWASRYADDEILNWIEQPLFRNTLTDAEKNFVITMLQNSQEREKANKILMAHSNFP